MARQKSPFKFEGPIDDLTFYKTKHGNLVRRKGRVSANRLKKHPRFQRFLPRREIVRREPLDVAIAPFRGDSGWNLQRRDTGL